MSSALQGEYLSSIRNCYDDRRFHTSLYSSQEAAADAARASAAAAAAAEGGDAVLDSVGTNFQQKIELAPLAQLTALGDIAAQQKQQHDDDDELGRSDAATAPSDADVRVRSAVESRSGEESAAARRSVIVVASLVSKVPNLAGLARTCEIFSAQQLLVADLKRTQADPEFQNISVTAHRSAQTASL